MKNETKFIKDDGVISKTKKNIVYSGSKKKCLKSFQMEINWTEFEENEWIFTFIEEIFVRKEEEASSDEWILSSSSFEKHTYTQCII